MKFLKTLGPYAVGLALLGICFPMMSVAGDIHAPIQSNGAIADIALGPDGLLIGRIVNAQGQPMSNIPVSIRQINQEVARTTTDENGTYVIRDLQGGVYHVVAGNGTRICRLWASQTAPPSALKGLLVVSNPEVILAQYQTGPLGTFFENAKYTLTNPLIIGGIVAAAVAIPVAIHNSNDDESGS
ncbi:MAG: carboxypeptidase regulatory-like domain-containing protein [Pirellulales bacterium]|nr:carboxypeptidase regulatory-like domain-containing protein [Pirellulales bacterium]